MSWLGGLWNRTDAWTRFSLIPLVLFIVDLFFVNSLIFYTAWALEVIVFASTGYRMARNIRRSRRDPIMISCVLCGAGIKCNHSFGPMRRHWSKVHHVQVSMLLRELRTESASPARRQWTEDQL